MSVPSVPPPTYTRENEVSEGSSAAGQGDDLEETTAGSSSVFPSEAQLLICSTSGAISQFQKGYLGAHGERAAIEGELQIKGVPLEEWESLTVSFRTCESTGDRDIELNAVEVELYARSQASTSSSRLTLPSSVPFSIPLTDDTPQCLHIGRSSLSHNLTATLITIPGSSTPDLTRTVVIHTHKFSSHLDSCATAPQTFSLNNPTKVDVQVPRLSFRSNEPIPVYVTVPPPDRSVVLDHGFTLRSIRAELVRTVALLNESSDGNNDASSSSSEGLILPPSSVVDDDGDSVKDGDSSDTTSTSDTASISSVGIPPSAEFLSSMNGALQHAMASSDVPEMLRSTLGPPYESVVARSGGACRFHSSKPVKLRLVLHGSFSHNSPALFSAQQLPLPSPSTVNYPENADDANCASITQTTLLHAVSFRVQVRATFLHVSTRSERTFPLVIPITLLPPPAPLPEVDPAIDSEYRKKHDQPPSKTVRQEEEAPAIYDHDYDDGNQPGPSAHPTGAPPPFDDAPPPFSSSMSTIAESSTSSRLPTFLESESEIILPSVSAGQSEVNGELNIPGEGVVFGFRPTEQYDGYSEDIGFDSPSGVRLRSGDRRAARTPPPTLEMALQDNVASMEDLAGLVNANVPSHPPLQGMDALHIALEEQTEARGEGSHIDDVELPPPPPLMDDPSDPPPSIDSDFRLAHNPELQLGLDPPPSILSDYRSPGIAGVLSGHTHTHTQTPSPPGSRNGSRSVDVLPTTLDTGVSGVGHEEPILSPSHAPPPYLNPGGMGDAENVAGGPPPYVDLVHSHHSH